MLILSNKKRGVKSGETDFDFWVDILKDEDKFLGNESSKQLGINSILKSQGNFGHAGRPGRVGGSASRAGMVAYNHGDKLPDHLSHIKIPPAWTNILINPDPKADVLVTGDDIAGRTGITIYSAKHDMRQAEAKFKRVKELDQKYKDIYQQNETNLKSSDKNIREHAQITKLIMETGIRPGGEKDTKAKVKAYGATTLEGRHVVQDGNNVSLQFVGKKGKSLNIPVENRSVANILINRSKKSGSDSQLFKNVNANSLLTYVKQFDGGGFKTKDFRTRLANDIAEKTISKVKKPKNEKEYKKAVMNVAKAVSTKLGNTPSIALKSYINPGVFGQWRGNVSFSAAKIIGLGSILKHLPGRHDQMSHGHGSSSGNRNNKRNWYHNFEDAKLTEKESKDISRWGKENRKNANLTSVERSAIIEYRKSSAFEINDYLRNGKVSQFMSTSEMDRVIKNVDSAVGKAIINKDLIVYRGISKEFKLKVGSIINDKAFLSTTLNTEEAFNFSMGPGKASTIFKIDVPKGSKGLYVEGLQPRGYEMAEGKEHEVLLPRNTSIKVTDVQKYQGTYYVSGKIVKKVLGKQFGIPDLLTGRPFTINKLLGIQKFFSFLKVDMTRQDWLNAWKEDPHWADDSKPSGIAKDFYKLLKKENKNSLLEIGCGIGRDSIYFAEKGIDRVIGIDLSPDAIKRANKEKPKKLNNLVFEVGDAEKLKYKDKQFDSVYSLSVLHSTDMKKSFREINRILQDDGLMLFYLYIKTKYDKSHTEVNFKIEDVKKLFKDNNFKIIDEWKAEAKDEYDDENPHIHYIVVYTLRKEDEDKDL